jgi:putative flippase GtrA
LEVLKNNMIIPEFLRYLVVGGISFIVDFTTLFVVKEFVLKDAYYSLYISTALGFLIGLMVNYLLSLYYVFNSAKGTGIGRSVNEILIFVAVGIIGLFISEFVMFVGAERFELNYLIVKVGVTIVVLLWNYLARKILIFK